MSDRDDPPPTLQDIEARLKAARGSGKGERSDAERRGVGLAYRISVELVAGVAVGAGIGYLLDGWLGTRPMLMAVFVFLGFAAAMLNIFRLVRGLDNAIGLGRAIRLAEENKAKPGNKNAAWDDDED